MVVEIDPCGMPSYEPLKGRLVDMMQRTTSTGDEHGLMIVQIEGKLYATKIQEGKDSSIKIEPPKKWGFIPYGNPIATFHTHPTEMFEDVASFVDLKTTVGTDLKYTGVVYDEGKDTVVAIFKPKGYEELDKLVAQYDSSTGRMRLIDELNEQFHACTVRL